MMNKCLVNFVGMPYGEHGLGMELVDKANAFIASGFDIEITNIDYSSLKISNKKNNLSSYEVEKGKSKASINLICLNLSMYHLALRDYPEVFSGKYNILLPYWEFSELPNHHVKALHQADEIWVPCNFLESVFKKYSIAPVLKMPLHIEVPTTFNKNITLREKLGLSENDFVFLMNFDANSLMARKDPQGALLAFERAFHEEDVKLVIKTKFTESKSVNKKYLNSVIDIASRNKNVIIVDENYSADDMLSLIASCDVFISPHRCEGLGRSSIEAMQMSKPIIITPYSGFTEYLDDNVCSRIPYVMTDVGEHHVGDIKSHYKWAMVDYVVLSGLMRKYYQDPEFTHAQGNNAHLKMSIVSSKKIFSDKAKNRIDKILSKKSNSRFELSSGERQTGNSISNIRKDHLLRYYWAKDIISQELSNDSNLIGLDVFCGNGYGSNILSDLAYMDAIDGSEEAIDFARNYFIAPNINFLCKMYPFDIPKNNYDFVVSIESIEHIDDYKGLLTKAIQSLKVNGVLIISVPNENLMPHNYATHKFHVKHFTVKEINDFMINKNMKLTRFSGQRVYDICDVTGNVKLVDEDDMELKNVVEDQFVIFCFKKQANN